MKNKFFNKNNFLRHKKFEKLKLKKKDEDDGFTLDKTENE
jgi:hypothetical protein